MTALKALPSVALVAFSVAVLIGGCVHTCRPIGVPEIPLAATRHGFDGTIPVEISPQQGVERHTIFRFGIHRYDIEPDEWSQDFATSLATELRRRGVHPGDGAIEVTVAVNLEQIVERTVPALAMRVTFQGFDKTYPSLSGHQAPSLPGELRRAMKELLEDPEFRDGLRAAHESDSETR